MEIVTGSTGEVHVTSIDDAVRNANVGYLKSRVVFTFLQNFAARAITNNEVRVESGYGINQGRIFKIDKDEYDSVTIENGSQGYKRADLIVARYTMNTQSGFEDISLVAIRGNSGSSYVDPTYTVGNINEGATQDDMPLYRVKINGTAIEAVERMFTLVPDGGRLGQLEATVASHMTAFNNLNIRTNLASESAIYPKNGANCRPGVEGTLAPSHGGTGQTSLKNAANSLAGSLDTNATNPSTTSTQDANTYYIGTTQSGTTFQRKPLSALKEWISAFIETRGYGDMTKKTFTGQDDGTVIRPQNGGTGQTSLQATRNAMGLGNTTGALPIANGGTGTTTAAGIRNAIGLGNTTGVLTTDRGGTGQSSLQATRNAMGLGNTTGALPVANGGTGLTSSPSMLTNLGSTTAAGVLQASPRPGVTGTLPTANGGTGQTSLQATRNAMGLGNTTGALPIANGGTGKTTAADARANLGLAYGTAAGTVCQGNDSRLSNKREPTSHASTGTGYGVGTASAYGHLKITDDPKTSHTAASGVTASGSYVRGIYLNLVSQITDLGTVLNEAILNLANAIVPKSGGTFTGNVTVNKADGTTSDLGSSIITIGNDIAVNKAKNSYGAVRIYSSGTTYITLRSQTPDSSRTLYLPATGTTLATSASSSARVKENIRDMTEEEALKILDIPVVKFDYKKEYEDGKLDQSGVIAEKVIDIIPEVVTIHPMYDKTKPIDPASNPSPTVDYSKFAPYLIKMVQMQQKEIEELKAALNK